VRNPNTDLLLGDWWFDLVVDTSEFVAGEGVSDSINPSGFYIPIVQNQLVNLSNETQIINYKFYPKILPNGELISCTGESDSIAVFINPEPDFDFTLADTVFCNNSLIDIGVSDLLGDLKGTGTKNYSLVTSGYNVENLEIFDFNSIQRVLDQGDTLAVSLSVQDSLVNNDTVFQNFAQYRLVPGILDIREGRNKNCWTEVEDTLFNLIINPTPKVSVTLADNILCDSEPSDFAFSNGVQLAYNQNLVYNLLTSYDGASVLGNVTPDSIYLPVQDPSIRDTLSNESDTVQNILYYWEALIRDDRNGQPSDKFCYDGNFDTDTIRLNPIPRFTYDTPRGDTL
jgi:hypothetical protein